METKTENNYVEDTLIESLLLLPYKSNQCFTTVCKHWNSVITNPLFLNLWRKLYYKPPTGLFLRTKLPIAASLIPISPNEPKPQIPPFRNSLKIKQSCNGLLLCSTKGRCHVYNPTNNTCHKLPKLADKVRAMSLAFDPLRFGNTYGYKVFCCVDSILHVYSSENPVWNMVLDDYVVGHVNDRGVYWNGCINWTNSLMYFDIRKEELGKIPEPPVGGHWRKDHYIGESRDCLIYAKLWKGSLGETTRVEVYEMKRDYSAWVQMYRVELKIEWCARTSMLSVVYGEKDNECFVVLRTGRGKGSAVVRFNLVPEVSEELPVSLTVGVIDRAFQYVESQYSVVD